MAVRYYLVPFETEEESMRLVGCKRCPKYMSVLSANIDDWDGCQRGLPPKVLSAIGDAFSVKHEFYVLRISSKTGRLFDEIEKNQDVILLNKTSILSNVQKLSDLGIDLGGITAASGQRDIEKRIVSWLTDDANKDFSVLDGN